MAPSVAPRPPRPNGHSSVAEGWPWQHPTLLAGRGETIYLIQDETWYRWRVSDALVGNEPAPETMEDIYDAQYVKGVFDRCSDQYIAFSLLCSFGFTERWRRQCVSSMPEIRARAAHGYDLMAGTGEVWPHLLRRFQSVASITAVDISSGMHRRAMQRLHAHRTHRIKFVEDDVLASELPANSADFVVSTFGLKTFKPASMRSLPDLLREPCDPVACNDRGVRERSPHRRI